MRIALLLSIIMLTACGGGSQGTASVSAKAQAQVTVFMGDSITALWPLADASINAGVPGQVTSEMLARFNDDVIARHPQLVVILGGTNDLRHLDSPTISNITEMVTRAESAGARVIVGLIPPINDWAPAMPPGSAEAGNQAVTAWNASLVSMCLSYGCKTANYHDAMVLADGSQNAALFKDDRLHPNEAGYAVMDGILNPLLH